MAAPEPSTVMSLLPPGSSPHAGYALPIGIYASFIVVAVSSAWICDAFLALPDEFRMLRGRRVNIPDIVFICSRVTTCGYLVLATVMATSRINCKLISQATNIFAALCLPCTSLLFLLRVWGVFHGQKIVIILFIALWMSTLGTTTQPFTIHRRRVMESPICLTDVESFSTFGLVAVAFFDTVVFVTISLRCMYHGMANSWKERSKSFFNGRNMGNVSRLLLQTGQQYYLVSIGVTLTATVVLVIPSIPPVVKCCVTFPGAALQNSMACRVFRLLRQGLLEVHPNILAFEDQERLNLHQSNINEVPQIPNILAAPTVCHIPKHRRGSIV